MDFKNTHNAQLTIELNTLLNSIKKAELYLSKDKYAEQLACMLFDVTSDNSMNIVGLDGHGLFVEDVKLNSLQSTMHGRMMLINKDNIKKIVTLLKQFKTGLVTITIDDDSTITFECNGLSCKVNNETFDYPHYQQFIERMTSNAHADNVLQGFRFSTKCLARISKTFDDYITLLMGSEKDKPCGMIEGSITVVFMPVKQR